MKKFDVLAVCLIFVLLWLSAGIALAQNSNSGLLEGTVKDNSGAVVPDVAIEILNVQAGTSQTLKSNSDGLYVATSVPLGEYTITFSKEGFESFVRKGVIIIVGTTTVDAALQVGQVSERVTVTGAAPLLETETSDQTTTLNLQAVDGLPVVGSDWRGLDGVLPGVNAAGNQGASGQYVGYNGTQGNSVAWLFDGSGAVLIHDYNPSQIYPPVDAIQEVNASTSNFSSQYGNGMSVINVITKSGTNRFHGTFFEMFQNNELEARNYFAQTVTPLRWNEFGGSLGGPIIKNKLFFFINYMENPAVQSTPTYLTFPTEAMRAGDFSNLSVFPTVYDPASLKSVNGVATRTPLPGNKVTTIDPVAAKIQAFWPLPNNPVAGTESTFNNFYQTVKSYETNRWYEGKVDYQINDRNRLSVSELVAPQNRPNPDPRCPLNCYNGQFKDQAGQITYTRTISANVVNEARVGYVREIVRETSESVGKGYPDQIGLINAPADIFPTINVTGEVSSELDGGTNALQAQGTEQYSDFITLVRGKHVIKIGGEYDRSYQNLQNWGDISSGNFTFNGIATKNPADPNSNGLGYADFLFGLPQSWNVTEYKENGSHLSAAAAFVQDDFKVTSKLTLNLGLRYQYLGGWYVKNNDFGVFDPTLINPATGTPGAMNFGGVNGRNTIQSGNPYFFTPRIGLAYSPIDKWVVRASYGMFAMVRSADPYTSSIIGAGSNAQGALTATDNINPVFSLGPNEGYGQGYVQGPPPPIYPTASTRTPDLLNGQNVAFESKSVPTQYIQEAYLNVQRELNGGVLLSAGYVFTKGTHLQFERDINQVPQALLGPGDAQSRRPYPQFNSITGVLWDGLSNYNALQLRAEKRTRSGLFFIANYAWSKTMDTGTGGGNTTGVDAYQKSYDPAANYALSLLDNPNMFNGMATYSLPFGMGRQFVNTHGPLEYLVGGWTVGAFFQVHGGVPFTPIIGTQNGSGSLAGDWFPNRVGKGTLKHPTIQEWFDISAFQTPAPFTFGDSGRNILRGPNWRSLDANLGKTFPIGLLGEGGGLEFRVDVFDLPNHPNFGQPNADIGTSGAGIISSANTSRNLQLTARLHF
jgi:Carboxypeptidase regulatory-like domain/TonB dependent receptor